MSFTSYCPCYVVVSIYVVGFFALWTIKKLTNSLNKLLLLQSASLLFFLLLFTPSLTKNNPKTKHHRHPLTTNTKPTNY